MSYNLRSFNAFVKRYGAALAALFAAAFHVLGVPAFYYLWLYKPYSLQGFIQKLWVLPAQPSYGYKDWFGGESARSLDKWLFGFEIGLRLRWHQVIPILIVLAFLGLGIACLRYRSRVLMYVTLVLATIYFLTYAYVILSGEILDRVLIDFFRPI